jgi:hypothetical protein
LHLQMSATSFAVRPAGVACSRSQLQRQVCHAVKQPAAASRGCRWQAASPRAATTKRRRLAAAEAAADSAEVHQGGDYGWGPAPRLVAAGWRWQRGGGGGDGGGDGGDGGEPLVSEPAPVHLPNCPPAAGSITSGGGGDGSGSGSGNSSNSNSSRRARGRSRSGSWPHRGAVQRAV